MDTLAERIAWAIETIKSDRDLDKNATDEELAGKLGTNKNTIGDYRKKKGLIKGLVLERLVSIYRFNPDWILEGKGEPFAGARGRYPEVCENLPEDRSVSVVAEDRGPYAKQEAGAEQPIKISESIRSAIEVLESGSLYGRLLQLYIQQFDEAVRNESRIKRMEEEQIRTVRELQALEQRLRDEFAQELLRLRSEIMSVKNPDDAKSDS
jgi:hypothetical protein